MQHILLHVNSYSIPHMNLYTSLYRYLDRSLYNYLGKFSHKFPYRCCYSHDSRHGNKNLYNNFHTP